MPDVLNEYVNQIAEKAIQDSECIMAVPATVQKVLSNGICLVQLVANDTQLVVPNWSGCDVEVGDEVRLFYTGAVLSERTAYIGAASYIVNRRLTTVKGNFIVDNPAAQRPRRTIPKNNEPAILISRYGFHSTHPQTVLVTFNGRAQADVDLDGGTTSVELYIDGVKYNFDYSISMQSRMSYCPIVSLPFQIDAGNHIVEVKISGSGAYSGQYVNPGFYYDCCSYVMGQGLKEVEVENG